MDCQALGRGREPVAHIPARVPELRGLSSPPACPALGHHLPTVHTCFIAKNNQNTTEKQLPGVTVERSICQRREHHRNRFHLQKYCSLRKPKLSVLSSLHKKYPPFFLTCIWLITTYSTIYVACIRKCNDC